MFSLKGQVFYLVFDLPDLLLSILKDEELFQFGSHVALKVLSERSGVNRAAHFAASIALNACSGLARTAIFSVRFTQRTVPLPST